MPKLLCKWIVKTLNQWREKSQYFYHLVCLILLRIDAGADFSLCCYQDCETKVSNGQHYCLGLGHLFLRVFIELLESIIFIKKFNDNMINDKYENV